MPPSPADGPLLSQELEALYQRLERPLYNVVLRQVWEAQEAEEIVQEAFVRLWDMRARVRRDTVDALVWRIALNLCSRRRRWKRLRSWFGLEGLSGGKIPDQLLGEQQREVRVRAAVERLPEELREVMLLCAYTELSYAEIGAVLELPEGTVGSRRNRALLRLKELLQEEVKNG